jgi:DNA mismatch repair protein MutS
VTASPRGKEETTPGGGRVTPMFRQWMDAKRQHPDALLLFRMGDFYELFFDDARTAAPLMEVALTTRGKGTATEAPMCGVPHHSVGQYVARLVERGHRVAICEQVEDPRKVKGMVRREVVRVVSPGTLTEPELLDPAADNYLAAIAPVPDGRHGVALVELSTGAMILADAGGDAALLDVLVRHEVREVLVPAGAEARLAPCLAGCADAPPLLTPVDDGHFHPVLARERVLEGLGVASLAGFGCPDDHLALPAAAAALAHLVATQRMRPAHLDRLRVARPDRTLLLDATTRRNLELVRSLRDGGRRNTLLETVDHTLTPMGARAARGWLLEPLREEASIRTRHDVVEDCVERPDLRRRARTALAEIRDLERLLARVALGKATPADLATLRRSLAALPELAAAAGELPSAAGASLAGRVDPLDDLHGLLEQALAEEPGAAPGDGRVLRTGWDRDLDEARELARGGRRLIAEIEARERERTGIGSLKVRYNRVFGYFIEVSKSNLSRVPDDYERRQTLSTGERFVTPEIRDLESRILAAEESLAERERELYGQLLARVAEQAPRLRGTAGAVGELDVLAGFAELAAAEGWVRPQLTQDDCLEILEGRHPVVERLLDAGAFVPNDCRLDDEQRLLVVTGPNMGGKSTYLRQVALITILAQAGAFVPARSARLALADRVFCRVGASDNLAEGESTFMVEMTETANILHNATPRSLVILDEIGRGTATWDGMALAWAVVEHLHDDPRLRPKALFATHYHELTELAARLPRLTNVHIAVREHGHEVVFLHRVEPGPSDRSYGIQVARLAGLPDAVVHRARRILERLTSEGTAPGGLLRERDETRQLELFTVQAVSSAEREVLAELRELDLDDLSPRAAHERLRALRERLSAND